MIILWLNWKDNARSQNFHLFIFCFSKFIHANDIVPNVPEHFVNNREIPCCQWSWTGSRPHSYFISADWTSFLPFLLFLPLKEHARTHTDFILSYYLPAVRLKCQALRCVCVFFFFSNSSSSNIWFYATLILAGFLLSFLAFQAPVDVLHIHNDIKL